jgi:asparagine synthase (glutamine-hydrolysing)
MSAINCCLLNNYSDTKSIQEVIHAMFQASKYWNPDALSYKNNISNNCILGKAHLYNTPLSKNDEVFIDTTTQDIITSNARIDNCLELIEILNIDKTKVTTSQIILIAYQKWGCECVKHLLGDFAFIIWDEKNQKLFCARDHFGIKSLFYSKTDKGIMISNEPNAFFESKWITKQINEEWLVNQIWNLGPFDFTTAYNELEILPPAHTLVADANGIKIERYWELKDKKDWENFSKDELLKEFKKRFTKAVERRLITDFELGCQLSEGLDSNGITGYTAHLYPLKNIYTFSYHATELNEKTEKIWGRTYKDIQEMIDMYPNLTPLWSTESNFDYFNYKIVENLGGSFNVNSQFLPHCYLASKNNVRVLLSGWGGDHCVSSYGDFYESELFSKGQFIKLLKLLRDKKTRGRGGKPLNNFIRLIIKHFNSKLYIKYFVLNRLGLENSLIERSQKSLLKDSFIKKYKLNEKLKQFLYNYQARFSTKDYSNRELFEIGVERRIMDSEFTGRMFKLEYRFPMLDVELIEFAYNLPSYLKVFNGVERYAFREIIKGYTTEGIRMRKKADVIHPNWENNNLITDNEKQQISLILDLPLYKKYMKEIDFRSDYFQQRVQIHYIKRISYLLNYWDKNTEFINE